MVVGSMTVESDIVVIGGGPGGYVAALRAAQLGKDVIIVENEGLGGICLNHGCIPTKAVIHASDFYDRIKDMAATGVIVKDYTVDYKKMKEWKEGILKKLGGGIQTLCDKYGVEVIKGKGVFASSTELHIEGKSDVTAIKFKHAIIATGSLPIEVPGFPFFDEDVMSSRDALSLKEIPHKLAIIGGGYIGTEMGTVYGKLGSEVHIVEMQDRLIPTLEKEIVDVVAKKLKGFNVNAHLKSKALGMEKRDGKVILKIEEDGKPVEIPCDKILVVVGRRPNSKDMGLDKTKVQLDSKGFITVNERQQTTDPNIFAIGDVVGQPMLAHKASKEGKVAAEVICGKPSAFDNKVIPFVVFNDPEIASVGLTESQAAEKGIDVKVGKFPFAALGRAQTLNQTDGFVKTVIDAKTGVLLGVHAVGPSVSDIISEAALAIEMGATAEDIALTIHPHPTLGEAVMESAEAALGTSVHIFAPPKK